MKKGFGRFLILVCLLCIAMFLGAAVESLMPLPAILLGIGLCFCGIWASNRVFLCVHSVRRHTVRVSLSHSNRAA